MDVDQKFLVTALEWVPKIRKALAAAVVAIGITTAALADQQVTLEEASALVVAWGGVYAVFRIGNKPDAEAEATARAAEKVAETVNVAVERARHPVKMTAAKKATKRAARKT